MLVMSQRLLRMLCDITAIYNTYHEHTHNMMSFLVYNILLRASFIKLCYIYVMPCHGKAHVHAWHVLTTTQT